MEVDDPIEELEPAHRAWQGTDDTERPPCRIDTEAMLVLRSEPKGDVLVTSLDNHRDVSGTVRLTVAVSSEHGDHVRDDLPSTHVDANGSGVVELPIDDLELPRTQGAIPRTLELTGEIEYEDGVRETAKVPVHLFFHTDDAGELQIYDRARARQLSAAALREDDAFSELRAAHGIEPGETAGVAHVSAQPRALELERSMVVSEGEPRLGPAPAGVLTDDTDPTDTGIKICVRQHTTFTDAGVGEDYWTINYSYARYSLGTTALITHNQAVVFFDQLGDGVGASDPGMGCTPVLTSGTGAYTITLFSAGEVLGHSVRAVDYDTNAVASHSVNVNLPYATNYVNINAAAQHSEFNAYMAGAYAAYRHDGGTPSQSYEYAIDAPGSWYAYPFYQAYLHDGDEFLKFVIVHEGGHALADNNIGDNRLIAYNSDLDDISCPSPEETNSHAMTSMEYSASAAGEGFAHFYAASVFNSNAETDCKVHYYKQVGADPTPTVDCEFANGPFDVKYMENNCIPGYDGRGVELDWLRTFWDVSTNGVSPPSFNDMIQWMDAAVAWDDFTAYDELDIEAQQIGGSLDANWNSAAGANGIDW